MREYQVDLGFEADIFDLVYEGFWEVYTFKAQIPDVSAKKLQAWIPKIKLVCNDNTPKVQEGEDEAAEEVQMTPLSAYVRIKLAKVKPEMEEDEEGNLRPSNIPEEQLEDVPAEDKCLSIITQQNGTARIVSNEAAGRYFRYDLIKEMSVSIEALKGLDLSEFNSKCDAEANRLENEFCKLFEDEPSNESRLPRIPVFDFRPAL